MTRVSLFLQQGRMVGFEIKGHTGFSEEGSDIVCSAVSVLSQTAVMGIVEYLKLPAAYEISEASIYCMLDKSVAGEPYEKAETIFETMALGLRSIAANYGDYIRIVDKEV